MRPHNVPSLERSSLVKALPLILFAIVILSAYLYHQSEQKKLHVEIDSLQHVITEKNQQIRKAKMLTKDANLRFTKEQRSRLSAETKVTEAEAKALRDKNEKEAALKQVDQAEIEIRQASLAQQHSARELQMFQENLTDSEASLRVAEQEKDVLMFEKTSAIEEAEEAKFKAEKLQKEIEKERLKLRRALDKVAATTQKGPNIILNLDSRKVEFDFNKADLRPANRELLSRIVGILLTIDNYGIQVRGHTDDIGADSYNQTLSEQRAKAVHNYLLDSGIDAAVLSVKGFGKSRPIAPGTDDISRQKNRRVELAIVMYQDQFVDLE